MKRKKLKAYFNKQWKHAGTSLETYFSTSSPDELHRFRVQVKKLRAFIQLAERRKHAPDLKQAFKPVRTIFKKAGAIRDAQLRLALAANHHAGKELLRKEEHALEVAAVSLRSERKQYLAALGKAGKQMQRNIRSVKNKVIRKFYRQELKHIARVLAGRYVHTDLHACRKHIKILIYNEALAGKVLRLSLDKDYLEQLAKAIGDWHDNLIASRLFPELKTKDKDFRDDISRLSRDFYARATSAVAP